MYYANLEVTMPAQSVEEELAELAALVDEAERLGFDPWPPDKPIINGDFLFDFFAIQKHVGIK